MPTLTQYVSLTPYHANYNETYNSVYRTPEMARVANAQIAIGYGFSGTFYGDYTFLGDNSGAGYNAIAQAIMAVFASTSYINRNDFDIISAKLKLKAFYNDGYYANVYSTTNPYINYISHESLGTLLDSKPIGMDAFSEFCVPPSTLSDSTTSYYRFTNKVITDNATLTPMPEGSENRGVVTSSNGSQATSYAPRYEITYQLKEIRKGTMLMMF